jgi:hypothetical protein
MDLADKRAMMALIVCDWGQFIGARPVYRRRRYSNRSGGEAGMVQFD